MYEFSISSFFVGIVVLIIGALMVVFHQKLADNLGSGLASYDKFKLWGLIVCGAGLVLITSLHTIPLNWLLDAVFRR